MITDYYETTDPIPTVISIPEAEAFLRLRQSVDTGVLTALLQACTEKCQQFTNRDFGVRNFEGFFSGTEFSRYPDCPGGYYSEYIQIRRSPLKEVSAVTIFDGTSYQPYTGYELKQISSFSRILFKEDYLFAQNAYPIKVTFSAGYTTVPEPIKNAILQYTAFLYENRGDTLESPGIPAPAKLMLTPYKIINSFG